MGYRPETPFDHIESAYQYVDLLAESVEETRLDIDGEMSAAHDDERRRKALLLVSYNLNKLSSHMRASRRILNDLRTLRRLLLSERQMEAAASSGPSPKS